MAKPLFESCLVHKKAHFKLVREGGEQSGKVMERGYKAAGRAGTGLARKAR